MKVSIITVCLNSEKTIAHCIKSVNSQNYKDIEHIIIDGGSTDGTVDIIQKSRGRIAYWVSEKDNGIYDGMNKGIKVATGDIIGILNSDDFYSNERVIEKIVTMITDKDVDSSYGDIVYVDREDVSKVVRTWKAGDFKLEKFKFGWMPPHPTFFCKKKVYEKYGYFNISFPLAADYELMLRFLYKNRISTIYIEDTIVNMRYAGTSRPGKYTIGAIKENYLAWKVNGLNYPLTMLLKPFSKIKQFFER